MPSPSGVRPATARSALANRSFRLLLAGSLASNIGTWMQTVVLGAYVYHSTGSALAVSLVSFAQLGPLLALSVVGGVLTDAVDLRRLLLAAQVEQLLASVALAVVVRQDDPSLVAVCACVAALGIGNALHAPAWAAAVPSLVRPDQLGAAVSLSSAQMNASRVLGPAIGGLLYPLVGASGVFLVNAASYLLVIATILAVRLPAPLPSAERGLRRLTAGFRTAREDSFVGGTLVLLFAFSLLSLPIVYQFPTLAADDLGMDVTSLAYGLLYAAFGTGALLGALAVGTVLAHADRLTVVRRGLVGHALCLGVLALLRTSAPAYPVALALGACYFATVTSLNTLLQTHLQPAVRGRVMGLWIMAFGGSVPLGLLLAGAVAERTSISVVLAYGAVAALVLAWRSGRLRR